MSQLKSLAGQTAIYGVSSILGRVLNYALVPLHTTVFLREEMGQVAYLYAYVAFFLITYTFGMETTFFRFTTREKDPKYYHYAGTVILVISAFFTLALLVGHQPIANMIGYPDSGLLIMWLAIILFFDAVTAIPFAKLRIENKARKFATTKLVAIVINVGLQLMFLIVFPDIAQGKYLNSLQPMVNNVYDDSFGIGYIFLANLISSIAIFPLLWKPISEFRFHFKMEVFKPMMKYATPIFITGLAGMGIEQIDKILIEQVLPANFYSNMNSQQALGVYSQTLKLSIFMSLAIQAFRYAGEPFFFSKADDKNSPQLFSRVMHYFVLFSIVIFVAISTNVELIGQLFLRNPEYRVALYLVPLLLFGKLLWGVYVNLSIWFKLTDRTIYGTYFNLVGAVVVVVGNLLLLPIIGLDGSAIAMIASYLIMCIFCYYTGKKYFPVPYKFWPIVAYLVPAIVLVYGSFQIQFDNIIVDRLFNLGIAASYALVVFLIEKKKLYEKST